jgi:hypothetical protein
MMMSGPNAMMTPRMCKTSQNANQDHTAIIRSLP